MLFPAKGTLVEVVAATALLVPNSTKVVLVPLLKNLTCMLGTVVSGAENTATFADDAVTAMLTVTPALRGWNAAVIAI